MSTCRSHVFALLLQSQVMFIRVTKEHITFNFRRWAIFRTVLANFMVLPTYFLLVYPPYLEFWQLICFHVSSLMVHTVAFTWSSLTRGLTISARALNKYFKVSLCWTLHNISIHHILINIYSVHDITLCFSKINLDIIL
jgi:hypothetical protein